MVGKWVGCNYDYEFTWGYSVIAKNRDFALEKMQKILTLKTGLSNKKKVSYDRRIYPSVYYNRKEKRC